VEFEKLLIGPACTLGEMLTGGHYLEVLRIGKQTLPNREVTSYRALHQTFVAQSGALGAFYRGFWPWGALQCTKGIPVLFVQTEAAYQLSRQGLSKRFSDPLSGVAGGAAQAVFVCPTQKLKVVVVADPLLNSMSPLSAATRVVKSGGALALFDGLLPMMVRRGLDWMIRFGMSARVKEQFVQRRRTNGLEERLPLHELMLSGMLGGSFSAVTHPIDNVITNSQKPLEDGARRDVASVVKRMWRESGRLAFTRGLGVKVVDNSYHTMWMYGIGTFVSEAIHSYLNDENGRRA
jgi:hypothetical protein